MKERKCENGGNEGEFHQLQAKHVSNMHTYIAKAITFMR